MLVPSLICLSIWIYSMISAGTMIFPWPLFVLIGSGGYFSRLVFGRESAIEEERERLRKKQAKLLVIHQQATTAASDNTDAAIPSSPEPGPLDADGSRPDGDDLDGYPDPKRRPDHWR